MRVLSQGIRKETRLLDVATGEVIKEMAQEFPPHFDEEHGYLFWSRKQFARSFADVPFPVGMSHDEIGKMTVLSKHMYSQTNMLGYRGNGGVRPHNLEQIGELIGLGPRQARRFMDHMVSIGLVAKVKVDVARREETQWYINPVYFFNNNRLPLNLYLIFRQQLNAVLPKWVIDRFGEVEQAQQ